MNETAVVFIDDDPDIRLAMAQTLSLEDLPVECYSDGESGLAALTAHYEGVVLCDYNMPGLDGVAVLKRIQAIDDAIPVIILTGQGDISTAVSAMQQGAYDFI